MNESRILTPLRKNALVGLLRMDFQRHKEGFLIGLPSIALMALLIGMIENAGGTMFLWMGLAMGVGCGVGFGRGERALGLEEYSLGLPPTRSDRYYVRFALGIAFLLTLLLCGLAAGPFGWVRALWELTPLELPIYRAEAAVWETFSGNGFYVLGVGLTFSVFSEFYAVCMSERQKNDSLLILSTAPFCIGTLLIIAADCYAFPGQVGYLSGCIGLAYSIPRTFLGARAFGRKDVALDGASMSDGGGSRQQLRVLAVAVALATFAGLAVWIYLSRR